jgi:hypothetical protein
MCKSLLSYFQLKGYLSFIVENDLIKELPRQIKSGSGNEKLDKIIEKGLHLLQISQEIESLMGLKTK